jgi:hypothetical protein
MIDIIYDYRDAIVALLLVALFIHPIRIYIELERDTKQLNKERKDGK